MEKKSVPASENCYMRPRIFYMKVNINCCDACPRRVKKKLQELHGVVAITMDTKQGLVAVSGTVDPQLVIRKFAKWGKKAIPWSPQIANANAHCNQKINVQHATMDQHYCCHEDDFDFDFDFDSDHDHDHKCNEHASKSRNNGSVSWQHPDLLKNPVANVSTKKAKKNRCCFLRLFCNKEGNDEAKLQGGEAKSQGAAAPAPKPNTLPAVGNRFSPRGPIPEHGAPRPYYPAYGSQYYRPTVQGWLIVPPYPYYQAMHPPPPPNLYGISQSGPPPLYNPMIHYNRYEDNYI